MTNEEVSKQIRKLVNRRHELLLKIERAARTVIPVLLDAERKNSAGELQQLFFELDATDQEVADFMKANTQQALEAVLRQFEK